MGKITEGIKISLNVSLKGSPKGVFPTNKKKIKIFILKFAKNTTFYPKIKNWHFRVKSDVWAPNYCENIIEKTLFVIKKRTIMLEVPSTDYSLSMGNFRGILASQRVGLFFWTYLCAFYSKEGWVCMILCVTEYCFH